MFLNRKALLAGLVTVLSGVALPTIASANFDGTYAINPANFYNCNGSCGTVVVSGDGTNAITFTISGLTSGLNIHGTTTTIALNFSTSTTNDTVAFNAAGTNGTVWSTTVQTSGVGQQDGFGSLNTGINCNGSAAGNLCGTTVKFTLSNAQNIESLANNDSGHFFTMKLATTSLTDPNLTGTGNTGFATLSPVPAPLVGAGLPGLVVACGGLIALARRRRQKFA